MENYLLILTCLTTGRLKKVHFGLKIHLQNHNWLLVIIALVIGVCQLFIIFEGIQYFQAKSTD